MQHVGKPEQHGSEPDNNDWPDTSLDININFYGKDKQPRCNKQNPEEYKKENQIARIQCLSPELK